MRLMSPHGVVANLDRMCSGGMQLGVNKIDIFPWRTSFLYILEMFVIRILRYVDIKLIGCLMGGASAFPPGLLIVTSRLEQSQNLCKKHG